MSILLEAYGTVRSDESSGHKEQISVNILWDIYPDTLGLKVSLKNVNTIL